MSQKVGTLSVRSGVVSWSNRYVTLSSGTGTLLLYIEKAGKRQLKTKLDAKCGELDSCDGDEKDARPYSFMIKNCKDKNTSQLVDFVAAASTDEELAEWTTFISTCLAAPYSASAPGSPTASGSSAAAIDRSYIPPALRGFAIATGHLGEEPPVVTSPPAAASNSPKKTNYSQAAADIALATQQAEAEAEAAVSALRRADEEAAVAKRIKAADDAVAAANRRADEAVAAAAARMRVAEAEAEAAAARAERDADERRAVAEARAAQAVATADAEVTAASQRAAAAKKQADLKAAYKRQTDLRSSPAPSPPKSGDSWKPSVSLQSENASSAPTCSPNSNRASNLSGLKDNELYQRVLSGAPGSPAEATWSLRVVNLSSVSSELKIYIQKSKFRALKGQYSIRNCLVRHDAQVSNHDLSPRPFMFEIMLDAANNTNNTIGRLSSPVSTLVFACDSEEQRAGWTDSILALAKGTHASPEVSVAAVRESPRTIPHIRTPGSSPIPSNNGVMASGDDALQGLELRVLHVQYSSALLHRRTKLSKACSADGGVNSRAVAAYNRLLGALHQHDSVIDNLNVLASTSDLQHHTYQNHDDIYSTFKLLLESTASETASDVFLTEDEGLTYVHLVDMLRIVESDQQAERHASGEVERSQEFTIYIEILGLHNEHHRAGDKVIVPYRPLTCDTPLLHVIAEHLYCSSVDNVSVDYKVAELLLTSDIVKHVAEEVASYFGEIEAICSAQEAKSSSLESEVEQLRTELSLPRDGHGNSANDLAHAHQLVVKDEQIESLTQLVETLRAEVTRHEDTHNDLAEHYDGLLAACEKQEGEYNALVERHNKQLKLTLDSNELLQEANNQLISYEQHIASLEEYQQEQEKWYQEQLEVQRQKELVHVYQSTHDSSGAALPGVDDPVSPGSQQQQSAAIKALELQFRAKEAELRRKEDLLLQKESQLHAMHEQQEQHKVHHLEQSESELNSLTQIYKELEEKQAALDARESELAQLGQRRRGLDSVTAEADRQFALADVDHDGTISKDEWRSYMKEKHEMMVKHNKEMAELVIENNQMRRAMAPDAEKTFTELRAKSMKIESQESDILHKARELEALEVEKAMLEHQKEAAERAVVEMEAHWMNKFKALGLKATTSHFKTTGTCTSEDNVMVERGIGDVSDDLDDGYDSGGWESKPYVQPSGSGRGNSSGYSQGFDSKRLRNSGLNVDNIKALNGVSDTTVYSPRSPLQQTRQASVATAAAAGGSGLNNADWLEKYEAALSGRHPEARGSSSGSDQFTAELDQLDNLTNVLRRLKDQDLGAAHGGHHNGLGGSHGSARGEPSPYTNFNDNDNNIMSLDEFGVPDTSAKHHSSTGGVASGTGAAVGSSSSHSTGKPHPLHLALKSPLDRNNPVGDKAVLKVRPTFTHNTTNVLPVAMGAGTAKYDPSVRPKLKLKSASVAGLAGNPPPSFTDIHGPMSRQAQRVASPGRVRSNGSSQQHQHQENLSSNVDFLTRPTDSVKQRIQDFRNSPTPHGKEKLAEVPKGLKFVVEKVDSTNVYDANRYESRYK